MSEPDRPNNLERRKKILRRSIIPIMVVLVASIMLSLPGIATSNLIKNYENQDYDAASSWGNLGTGVTIFHSWMAHYNYGTSLYMQKRYSEAEESFTKALDRNPPAEHVCDVRLNLAVSIIRQAELMSQETQQSEIMEMVGRALEIMAGDDCPALSGSGEEPSGEEEEGGEESEEETETEEEEVDQDQEDELKELIQQGEEEHQTDQREDEARQDWSMVDKPF